MTMHNVIRLWASLILALVAAGASGASEPAETKYRVESAVWCSGSLRGEPELVLVPGTPGQFEINGADSRWRLNVEVEPSTEYEGAAPGAVWLKVGIEQYVDGQWQFITDTMLGTPLGQPGRITVVEQGQAESDPDTAPLYVEMTATAVAPEEQG
ncbi:MAG: hypothetical protein RQ847_12095 [Wenzhouxiangellaceae bacterium]|nr:hypothetical protein [Wenzhouxiangellaceae bacterium]